MLNDQQKKAIRDAIDVAEDNARRAEITLRNNTLFPDKGLQVYAANQRYLIQKLKEGL